MPKIRYIEKDFRRATLARIQEANDIIAEYQAQGFNLTLRQLYYQFVARALIPNNQKEYDKLGVTISDARLAGLVDWDALEDRTRNVEENSHWSSPASIIQGCASRFRLDLWADQPYRPQVWIEKQALIGVIEGICSKWDVPWFAVRGYNSQSQQWRSGELFRRQLREGQEPVILHLGDHDPSGLDMTRDNADRLEMFAGQRVEVRRLALNMDQVQQYGPPPNPAKITDSRAQAYIAQFGAESWELDALEPRVISDLIDAELRDLVDMDAYDARKAEQEDQRHTLDRASDRWAHLMCEECGQALNDCYCGT